MTKLRSISGNLAVSAISLLVLLLAAELLLQVVAPLFRPRFTRIDPVVGWYHWPVANDEVFEDHAYHLSYNSHGFRPPEHSYENTEGVRRIVILGDSYTDASEVGDRETFTWLLQERLDGTEVINLGVYGYSTVQELLTLETVGLRYAPDLVILMTTSNDFIENHQNLTFFGPRPWIRFEADSALIAPTDHPAAKANFRATNLPLPGMSWLHRHSHVYYVLNHYVYQRLIAEKIGQRMELADSVSSVQREDAYLQLVLRMHETSAAAGADFLVVFAYGKGEVAGGHRSSYERHSRLAKRLAERGVATTDLYDELLEAEARIGGSLYYQDDVHWNVTGHRVVADLLEPRIAAWAASRPEQPESESIR